MTISTIPAWYSFTDVLARRLLTVEPIELAETLVLLPNRRACRSLKEALAEQAQGRAMILPRMMPFADLDPEDAVLAPEWLHEDILPPIHPQQRLGILMQLIIQYGQAIGESGYGQAGHSVQLATELARLIDQIHWEGLPFSALLNLVPDDYAQHWQLTLDFLKIVTEHWPAILASRGVSDPAAWRRDLILTYAQRWLAETPSYPIIAAGSTGSIPCTAALMKVVAGLPRGQIILPGLDLAMPEDEWQQLEITHPQYGMAELLRSLEVKRQQVAVETGGDAGSESRFKIISRAMQPSVGGVWSQPISLAQQACRDFHLLECAHPAQEAGVIALIMRETLEQEDRSVALVTPDRGLVGRVHKELARWDLRADDTAGIPLTETSAASFLILLAEALLEPDAILPLWKVLHHSLIMAGPLAEEILQFDKLEAREHRTVSQMCKASQRFGEFYGRLEQAKTGFDLCLAQDAVNLASLLDEHLKVAEHFVGEGLWSGEEGETLADFWTSTREAASDFPQLSARDYPVLLKQLMTSASVRVPHGYHPRLFVLGPLEARTIKADVMILGGLNEGTWPSIAESDPWLNRPMRADYGLPLPERRIGLSAHDFVQAFCAKHVFCTRSLRVNGTPAVASRWLLRLETVLKASQISLSKSCEPWASWHMQLDKPAQIRPCQRPAPRPPVSARPKQLSVTQIETWMRDPYVVYARHILRLKELDPLEKPLTVAEKGTLIHSILENFVQSGARDLPSLLALGKKIFADYQEQPEVVNFWWPRFERIAEWFVGIEASRRPEILQSYTEITGSLTISTDVGPFTVTAKADRIDLRRDGSVDLIDYKTGGIPSVHEVEQGLAPQMTLEAAILKAGGFAELGSRQVNNAEYWRLRGSHPAGEVKAFAVGLLADEALAGVRSLVESYGQQGNAYLAQPRAKYVLRYNPYAHLTRTQEWIREDVA